jgi:hypothetical protein
LVRTGNNSTHGLPFFPRHGRISSAIASRCD